MDEEVTSLKLENMSDIVLIKLRNTINKMVSERLISSYFDKLQKSGLRWIYLFRTPLHKNRYCIGVPKKTFDWVCSKGGLIIIGMVNSKSCNDFVYYVFNCNTDESFLSGYSNDTQYINFSFIPEGKKSMIYLKRLAV